MSVASKNPFALLNAVEVEEESKKQADKPIEAPKPNRKPVTTRGGRYYQRGGPKPATTTAPPTTDPLSPSGDKGERRPPRGDRGDRPFRGDRGDRGERGGRGGRRGGGGGRGYDRDARLDRHSATGITDSQKKVHQGWGGDRGDTEYKDETQGANDAAGDAWGASGDAAAGGGGGGGWDAPAPAEGAADDPWAAPSGDAAEGGDAKPAAAGDDEGRKKKRAEEEEEDNTMTLDQYRAKNATESEVIPKLELRQANEGANEIFKNAKQLVKDVDANNYFVGKQPKQAAPRARKEAKQYIEIEARFDPPSRGGRGRGRGDRGDRGGDRGDRGGYRGDRGDRGRGGRGGGRYQSQQAAEVNMDDTNAFPSL